MVNAGKLTPHDQAKALELAERLRRFLSWSGMYGTAPEPEKYPDRVYDAQPLDERLTVVKLITAALDARGREVWEKVRQYQNMRIALSDQSRCVEVLAGNIVKEAIENGAIAELRGLETWINEEMTK